VLSKAWGDISRVSRIDRDSHNGVIDFDTVNINEGSAFDRSRLSARQRSYYWLAASADLNTKSCPHYCCTNNVAAHEQQLNLLRHNIMDFRIEPTIQFEHITI
jgi:hypothetical protein